MDTFPPPPIQSPFDGKALFPSAPWIRWFQNLFTRYNAPITYTPTVMAGSGTFTTVSAIGRYRIIGKLVFIEIVITITTNGTAATDVIASLPFTGVNVSGLVYSGVLTGRAQASGKLLQGPIIINTANCTILNYDNTYPGASGETLVLFGFYEIP